MRARVKHAENMYKLLQTCSRCYRTSVAVSLLSVPRWEIHEHLCDWQLRSRWHSSLLPQNQGYVDIIHK